MLKSSKYKDKIAGYEKTLSDLNTRLEKLKDAVIGAKGNQPPTVGQINRCLQLTATDNLKTLNDKASAKIKELIKKYENVQSSSKFIKRKLMTESEAFPRELKRIREMIDEADQMEAVD